MPLPFHKNARPAAEASEEVKKQKGMRAFWSYHDKLFEEQTEEGALSREHLTKLALGLGVDRARFDAALDSHEHEARIQADEKAAQAASINGTPAFVINGYFISGAQPAAVFKKVVKRALADANGPRAKK
jgi:protein-disulfide isomerase